MEKERLDTLLVKNGIFETREKAKAAIMAGIVYVNGIKEDKPGTIFAINSIIEAKENINPYVSRGGLKLEKAIKVFGINLDNKIGLDIGASTGGFTDCMLQNGAKKVIAIDVGYGQFAWKLRNDERVVCMEKTNIRYVTPSQIGVLAEFASIDVSFISLKKVIPVVLSLLEEKSEIVCLIKPQFEAGKEKVQKHGVIRNKCVHEDVIKNIVNFAIENKLFIKGINFSPFKGPKGNIEFLLYLDNYSDIKTVDTMKLDQAIKQIINESHKI